MNRYSIVDYDGKSQSNNTRNKMMEYYEELPPEQNNDPNNEPLPQNTEDPNISQIDEPQYYDPNNEPPPQTTEDKGLSAGAIAGIVIAVIIVLGGIVGIILFILYKQGKLPFGRSNSINTEQPLNPGQPQSNTNQPGTEQVQGGLNDFDVNEFSNVDELYGLPI